MCIRDRRRCARAKVREGARAKSGGAEMLRTPVFDEKKTRTLAFPRREGAKVLCTPAMSDFPKNVCIGVPSGMAALDHDCLH